VDAGALELAVVLVPTSVVDVIVDEPLVVVTVEGTEPVEVVTAVDEPVVDAGEELPPPVAEPVKEMPEVFRENEVVAEPAQIAARAAWAAATSAGGHDWIVHLPAASKNASLLQRHERLVREPQGDAVAADDAHWRAHAGGVAARGWKVAPLTSVAATSVETARTLKATIFDSFLFFYGEGGEVEEGGELMVTVGGREVPISSITQSDLNEMTEEELEVYQMHSSQF